MDTIDPIPVQVSLAIYGMLKHGLDLDEAARLAALCTPVGAPLLSRVQALFLMYDAFV